MRELLGCILLILVLFFLFYSIVACQYKLGKKQFICSLFVLILVLSTIGALVVPNESYDLHRHYLNVLKIRNSGLTFFDAVFMGYRVTDHNYMYTYGFNALLYLCSKAPSVSILPFLTIMFCYSCFFYVSYKEQLYKEKIGKMLLAIAFNVIMIPYLYIYSGIRNAIAASLMAVAIYFWYKQKRNVLMIVVLTVLAASFHPVSLYAIPIFLLSYFNPSIVASVVVFSAPFFLKIIMEWFRLKSGNEFLFLLGAKYYNYTNVRTDYQGRTFLYADIIVLICIIIGCYLKCKNEPIKGNSIVKFIFWYALINIVFVEDYVIMTRLPYVLGILSPVIVNNITKFNKKKIYQDVYIEIVRVVTILVAALVINQTIVWMVN